MIPYEPREFRSCLTLLDVPTAWNGIEQIIPDIIEQFELGTNCALEFGVDYAYSTVAFSNYFKRVIGVDTFAGDVHAGQRDVDAQWNQVANAVAVAADNITLIRSDAFEFMERSSGHYDLIHIDIVHTYDPTFAAAMWSADHADLVMLHDTRSFPEVMGACKDVARMKGLKFYEWPKCHGVGLLTQRTPR